MIGGTQVQQNQIPYRPDGQPTNWKIYCRSSPIGVKAWSLYASLLGNLIHQASTTITERQNEMAEKYVPDERTRQNLRRTTKWSGDRQSAFKRIHSNDSKDDPRCPKWMEA